MQISLLREAPFVLQAMWASLLQELQGLQGPQMPQVMGTGTETEEGSLQILSVSPTK